MDKSSKMSKRENMSSHVALFFQIAVSSSIVNSKSGLHVLQKDRTSDLLSEKSRLY